MCEGEREWKRVREIEREKSVCEFRGERLKERRRERGRKVECVCECVCV